MAESTVTTTLTYTGYTGGAVGFNAKSTSAVADAATGGIIYFTTNGEIYLNGECYGTCKANVKELIKEGIGGVSGAMLYKGAQTTVTTTSATNKYGDLTPAANAGWVYIASSPGYVNGMKLEAGDMLICKTDDTPAATADTYTTINSNWDAIQTNIDVTTIYTHIADHNYTPSGKVTVNVTTATTTVTVYVASSTTGGGSVTAGSAASFKQGTDTFSQGKDTFTANVPTAVTLPTSRHRKITATLSDLTFTGTQLTSKGSYTPTGKVEAHSHTIATTNIDLNLVSSGHVTTTTTVLTYATDVQTDTFSKLYKGSIFTPTVSPTSIAVPKLGSVTVTSITGTSTAKANVVSGTSSANISTITGTTTVAVYDSISTATATVIGSIETNTVSIPTIASTTMASIAAVGTIGKTSINGVSKVSTTTISKITATSTTSVVGVTGTTTNNVVSSVTATKSILTAATSVNTKYTASVTGATLVIGTAAYGINTTTYSVISDVTTASAGVVSSLTTSGVGVVGSITTTDISVATGVTTVAASVVNSVGTSTVSAIATITSSNVGAIDTVTGSNINVVKTAALSNAVDVVSTIATTTITMVKTISTTQISYVTSTSTATSIVATSNGTTTITNVGTYTGTTLYDNVMLADTTDTTGIKLATGVITSAANVVTAVNGAASQYELITTSTGGIKVATAESTGLVAPAFNGTSATISVTGTPAGSVSGNVVVAAETVTSTTTADAIVEDFASAGSVTAGKAASFTQGTDKFTQGTDTFTANTPTKVTMPTFTSETVVKDVDTTATATFAGNAATITHANKA